MALNVNADTGAFDLNVVSTSGGDELPSWIWIVAVVIAIGAVLGVAVMLMARRPK